VRVPENAQPGQIIRIQLGKLLEIVHTPDSVPAIAVSEHGGGFVRSDQHAPSGRRGGSAICNRCGVAIWFFRSKTGRWYTCSSPDPRDFHSKTCGQQKAATP
jgi:hypothetical protein